jgi:hypothetical protein
MAELSHPQPPTPIHINNTTTVSIVNSTIKQQWSRAMEMQYFWLLDDKTQKYFKFQNQLGQENLATILPNITLPTFINMSGHIMYTRTNHHSFSHGQ